MRRPREYNGDARLSDPEESTTDNDEGVLSVKRTSAPFASLPNAKLLKKQFGFEWGIAVPPSAVDGKGNPGVSSGKVPKQKGSLEIRGIYNAFLYEEEGQSVVPRQAPGEPVQLVDDNDAKSDITITSSEMDSSDQEGSHFGEDDIGLQLSDEMNTSSTGNRNDHAAEVLRDDIVAQIQDLQRQLLHVKQSEESAFDTSSDLSLSSKLSHASSNASKPVPAAVPAPKKPITPVDSDFNGPLYVSETSKVIVCCVQRPVKMSRSSEGEGWVYKRSESGLYSAITEISKRNKTQWVNWPGTYVDDASLRGVEKKLQTEFNCVPVFLGKRETELFHAVYCRQVLWPIMHSILGHVDILNLSSMTQAQEAYVTANQKFLDVISSIYEEGDVVLVYDFHLMLLPAMLRRRYPGIRVGFFCSCPFPTYEYWRILPFREQLLRGILGADLVAFNHYNYLTNFTHTCTCLLGYETSPRVVEYEGRVVMLGYQPLAIESSRYVTDGQLKQQAKKLREQFKGLRIIVSNDRLDTVTGIPQKLVAIEEFFEAFPQWLGKVVLIQVVRDNFSKSMSSIRNLSRQVNELVGRVNGRYGNVCYTPVHLLKNSLSKQELAALYNIADVALVTSLSEGINLTSFEFIACQDPQDPGALVYSEFAGSAGLLKGAILINPYHTFGIARAINRALNLRLKKRLFRYQRLLNSVNTYRPVNWANRIFSLLKAASVKAKEVKQTPNLDPSALLSEYQRARRRLILLDFRGTIARFQTIPQLNKPSESLLNTLQALSKDNSNEVYILSGVNRECLSGFFGHLPVGLVAEQGYYIRWPHAQTWEKVRSDVQLLPWKEDIVDVLKYFAVRTPGSFLDVSDSCVSWNFKDTDKQFGLIQAKLLQTQLEQMLTTQRAKAVMVFEKQYLLVHSTSVHKGRAVKHILNRRRRSEDELNDQHEHKSEADEGNDSEQSQDGMRNGQKKTDEGSDEMYDMILAIGDDRSDEAMFKQLLSSKLGNLWMCAVDQRRTNAHYYIESPDKVVELLESLASV